MSNPSGGSNDGFERRIMESAIPVLLTFRNENFDEATNPLGEVEPEFEGRVTFLTVDVRDDDACLHNYGVVSLPTYLVVKDCYIRDVFVGDVPATRLRSALEVAAQRA